MNAISTPAAGEGFSQTHLDVEAVKAAMRRYVWSLDTRDWERLEDCFTPDIIFTASDMGRHEGAKNLIEKFQSRTARVPVRRHSVFNPYVRIDGDTAELTAYILNMRQRPRAIGGEFGMAGGYYRNTFVRTPTGWKMSALRWHGFFTEGNQRMDHTMPVGPTPPPVMRGPTESPWGGVHARGGTPDVSDMTLVRDLYNGMIRAADAGVRADVAASFLPDASADLQGKGVISGADAIADAFTAPDGDAWTVHLLSNEKTVVVGDTADFGAYVYRIAPLEGGKYAHSGGILAGTAKRTAEGWRLVDCAIHFLWERGKPALEDPLNSRKHLAELTRKLWANEDRRQVGTVEEEVTALLWKYTWSFDLNDPELNREAFAEDVDVTIYLDQVARHFGRHDWVTANMAGRNRQNVTMHYVSNAVVTRMYNPDLADLKTYVMVRRTAPGEPGPVLIAGGHYTGTARRIDGQWRFVTFGFQRAHGAYE